MKEKHKTKYSYKFYLGVGIILLMFLSYLIKINVDSGLNYIIKDSLLGILIFHNPFILALYILIAVVLIVAGKEK